MTSLDLIANPPCYVEGRRYQPIKVIEDWTLCHHLGCAVKYLARLGLKEPVLNDLPRIEWYLERELHLNPGCTPVPPATHPYTTDDVIDDWQLSLYLGEVLYHIKACQSPALRRESLEQALQHLRTELNLHSHHNPQSGDRL